MTGTEPQQPRSTVVIGKVATRPVPQPTPAAPLPVSAPPDGAPSVVFGSGKPIPFGKSASLLELALAKRVRIKLRVQSWRLREMPRDGDVRAARISRRAANRKARRCAWLATTSQRTAWPVWSCRSGVRSRWRYRSSQPSRRPAFSMHRRDGQWHQHLHRTVALTAGLRVQAPQGTRGGALPRSLLSL